MDARFLMDPSLSDPAGARCLKLKIGSEPRLHSTKLLTSNWDIRDNGLGIGQVNNLLQHSELAKRASCFVCLVHTDLRFGDLRLPSAFIATQNAGR